MSITLPDVQTVFACRCCGECCHGGGGIILRERDMIRLAGHFHLPAAGFCARYAEKARDKYRLRSGDDGACVFWSADTGCVVHEVKPDVCRAWPFFRGNLVDTTSYAMAGQACPGIATLASFDVFVRMGAAWLLAEDVFRAESEDNAPCALMTEQELKVMVAGE